MKENCDKCGGEFGPQGPSAGFFANGREMKFCRECAREFREFFPEVPAKYVERRRGQPRQKRAQQARRGR